jgi:glutamyl-tRNA reductase
MKLLVTGLSHKTAPVEMRERLAFRPDGLPSALSELRSHEGVAEALILSTCNRVEIAVAAEEGYQPKEIVHEFLAVRNGLDPEVLQQHLYNHEDREAVHHLFRVASSLDSMVIGEPQILGQLKTAYAAAKSCGTICGTLESVLTRSFGVAKRVRSETGIGQMAVSVSYAAVELARKIFGSLANHTVMIVGAGKMSELAAKHLRRSGASDVYVANQNANPPSVTVYGASAVDNAAPVRTIAGALTGFVSPSAVTLDTVNNELYVADFFGQAVRVFNAGASGDVDAR